MTPPQAQVAASPERPYSKHIREMNHALQLPRDDVDSTVVGSGRAGFWTVLFAGAQTPDTAQYTTIFSFDNYLSSGNSEPNSALIADSSGNLYGTTDDSLLGGGAFELTPAGNGTWTESFYGLTNDANGQTPNGLLLESKTGNLYGTTLRGGSGGCGVVFQLTALHPGVRTKAARCLNLCFSGKIPQRRFPTFCQTGRESGTSVRTNLPG